MLTKTLLLALAAGLSSAARIRNPRNVTSSAVDDDAAGANSLPDVVTTTTQVLDVYTTYCPEPTVLTFQDETYTVVAPTTLTITDCPCTIVEVRSPSPPPLSLSFSLSSSFLVLGYKSSETDFGIRIALPHLRSPHRRSPAAHRRRTRDARRRDSWRRDSRWQPSQRRDSRG